MNGLLTGLLARRETGLIEEIEKLERRIAHMENQANKGMWIAGNDMQLSQYTANRKRIPLNEKSEALAAVRILRYRGFSREQIEKEWKRQESQDKKSDLAIEFFHILQNKGIDYSISSENIAVHGTLDLRGTSITSLPDNLSVDGGFYLCYTGISNLPDDLKVGGSLNLENTCITRLPNNLNVGVFIYLHPEKIINIAYRKFLRNGDYTVFAVWINGQCCVVVNSMIYTLEKFYGETPTADVEQAARECVDGEVPRPATFEPDTLFTPSEQQIVFFALHNLTSKETGRRLGISHRTVENKLQDIYQKTRTHCNRGLEMYCRENGTDRYIPPSLLSPSNHVLNNYGVQ